MGEARNWRLGMVDRELVLSYLHDLESRRGVSARTRNLRLAAVHAFFHYLAGCEPELDNHWRRVLAIPTKKTRHTLIGYLETEELLAVLRSVRLDCPRAFRDLALLVLAYNTAARVHEMAQARWSDITRTAAPFIRIRGKGGRERDVPLWDGPFDLLDRYRREHRPQPRYPHLDDYLFLSVRGEPLTRFQVGRIITRYIRQAGATNPNIAKKRLTAHSMRHTTAVHLLQAGAELNVIRSWLGHADIETLQPYLDLDLTTKREVLERLVTPVFTGLLLQHAGLEAKEDIDLLDWLGRL
jgi:site-specific recombinase XerD